LFVHDLVVCVAVEGPGSNVVSAVLFCDGAMVVCVCVCPHLYLCTRVILSQFVYRVSEPRLHDEGGVVSHTWVGPKLCAL
jgi:hypothetical protein